MCSIHSSGELVKVHYVDRQHVLNCSVFHECHNSASLRQKDLNQSIQSVWRWMNGHSFIHFRKIFHHVVSTTWTHDYVNVECCFQAVKMYDSESNSNFWSRKICPLRRLLHDPHSTINNKMYSKLSNNSEALELLEILNKCFLSSTCRYHAQLVMHTCILS